MHLAEPIKVFLAMRRVKIEAKHLLLKFKSHLRGDFGVWHLLKSHFENRHKKPQKPCGIWDFCCGIYLGCTIWLREWDLNLTTYRNSGMSKTSKKQSANTAQSSRIVVACRSVCLTNTYLQKRCTQCKKPPFSIRSVVNGGIFLFGSL